MQDAISTKSKGGPVRFSPMRPYKVLAMFMYTENPFIVRFGHGYMQVRLRGFASLYSMNHLRLKKDIQFLADHGFISNLLFTRGRVLFHLEKPLWNERNQYSSAIQDLVERTKASPM